MPSAAEAAGAHHVIGLLRHAKSAYPAGVADARRPLSERGSRDAPAAGRLVAERIGVPDLVLVSTATRTQQTWQAAEGAFAHPPHHQAEHLIYDASVDDLLLLIRSLAESLGSVVLVGHNPGLEEAAFALSGDRSDPDAVRAMSQKFPTSALAVLSVERPWAHVVPGSARLETFDVARG
ncbi:MAG TPA: histidine phosphatase family protein [Actinomycetes bacterium]|nr:histidine phosphatase family protein [Actinomycetes bacterium]